VTETRATPTPARGKEAKKPLPARISLFYRQVIAELRKVQWPTRPQLWQATGVVIVVCIVIGVYIAALDAVLFRASRWLIDQYAAH